MYKALDAETTGLDLFHKAKPFMFCRLSEEGEYKTWQWDVDPFTRQPKYTEESVDELCHDLEGHSLVFHHATFDIRCLSRLGIYVHSLSLPRSFDYSRIRAEIDPSLPGWVKPVRVSEINDTQLFSHVCNSQGAGSRAKDGGGLHGLKALALRYLDIPEGDEKELQAATVAARRIGKKLDFTLGTSLKIDNKTGKFKAAIKSDYWMPRACSFWQAVPEEWRDVAERYCKGDVYRTLGLFFFFQEICKAHKLEKNYERELRLLPVTYLMEETGMNILPGSTKKVLGEFKHKYAELKKEAEDTLGKISGVGKFNSNSEKQLPAVLAKCGVPLHKMTEKGNYCTDADVLGDLAQYCEATQKNEIARALRCIVGWHPDRGDDVEVAIPGYRTWQTGFGYVSDYDQRIDLISRVHPSFNQVGTAWTRYSSSEPNGQNVSGKAVLPLRALYGPPPGFVWFTVDYSQLELRIYAYVSQEKPLIQAFIDGMDFHMATAVEIYSLPPEKITKEQRTIAKNTNFAVIFGAGPAKIDATSGRPGTYDLYMKKFPNAGKFIRQSIAEVEETGYTYTQSGYKLYVPMDTPHKVVSARVQGTAGCIMKQAMIDIHEGYLVDWEPDGSSIIANIHDELIFQFPVSYPYRAIARRIMGVMENAGKKLGIPTPVDGKLITTNWAEGEKFVA